jgi:hypothetical protein
MSPGAHQLQPQSIFALPAPVKRPEADFRESAAVDVLTVKKKIVSRRPHRP